jgi:hypothetical protein
MSHENLQAIVGRAIVDSAFRKRLLNRSSDVLADLELSSEESVVVTQTEATTIEDLASALDEWIAQQPASALERATV